MKDRPLYRAIALAALVTLIGCKKKPTASEGGEPARAAASNAVSSAQSAASAAASASHVIQSKDEVCNLLTRAEVGEELKKPMQPARQHLIQLGVPTECIYSAEGSEETGFALRLSFQESSVGMGFAHATFEVCGHDKQEKIQSLGDEAVLCRRLMVRKGDSFFMLSPLKDDPALPWADAAKRLAAKAVERLP
jgi:hypothetical protein